MLALLFCMLCIHCSQNEIFMVKNYKWHPIIFTVKNLFILLGIPQYGTKKTKLYNELSIINIH